MAGGIQDILSACDSDAFEYDPAQRYQEEHRRTDRAPPPTLPPLSVLMQPMISFEHSHQQVPMHHHPYQQHGSSQPFYSAPPSYQVPYYAPVSPTTASNWSPASVTSSVSSASESPFPIRRQTFYSHPSYNQQQRCTCGCDPASFDDGEVMASTVDQYAAAETSAFQTPASSPASKAVSEDVDRAESLATAPVGGKTSRYLREMDRRAILARLDKGEKQSVLAKEYHVSRSSICNLFKHRDEVLSRVNQNPFTKHPKRPKPTATSGSTAVDANSGLANRTTEKLITCVKAIYSPFAQSSSTNGGVAVETDVIVDTTGRVHRVHSRAATVLLQILDKPDLSVSEFRRCANQIMLLLLEEALAMLLALVTDATSAGSASLSPLLAITMEQANQHAMLDVFHSIEPNCPRGYVQFERSQWHQDVKIKLLDAQLSSALSRHNVLLLDVAVTSPSMVAFVVESLLRNGAHEAQITVVAVFVARAVVELVQSKFPAVRIIATDFESGHALDQRGAMPRSVLFKHRLEHMYSHAI